MTQFLNQDQDEDTSSSEEVQLEFDFINIANEGTKDREDDNLEAEEVYREPVVPFNLEELNISMPRLKYDVDEFYLEILRDKYSQFEKCLTVCR